MLLKWLMLMMVSETSGGGIGLRCLLLLTHWRYFLKPNSTGQMVQWQRWLKITLERLINLRRQFVELVMAVWSHILKVVWEPSKLILKLWNISHVSLLLLKTSCNLVPSLVSGKQCIVHHQHITMTKLLYQQLQAHLLSHQFMS